MIFGGQGRHLVTEPRNWSTWPNRVGTERIVSEAELLEPFARELVVVRPDRLSSRCSRCAPWPPESRALSQNQLTSVAISGPGIDPDGRHPRADRQGLRIWRASPPVPWPDTRRACGVDRRSERRRCRAAGAIKSDHRGRRIVDPRAAAAWSAAAMSPMLSVTNADRPSPNC